MGQEAPPRRGNSGIGAGTVHPIAAFPPELRRVIYATNAIESLDYQLRTFTKNRDHLPNYEAVVKLLWLARLPWLGEDSWICTAITLTLPPCVLRRVASDTSGARCGTWQLLPTYSPQTGVIALIWADPIPGRSRRIPRGCGL